MHTSGPWRVEECSGLHDFMVVSDEWTVAELCGDRHIAEANARLIAAAPEMLAVLRAFLAWGDQREEQKYPDAYKPWANARALLARLDGVAPQE